MRSTPVSVLDDGDVLYMHASTNVVQPLDAVFHTGLFSLLVMDFAPVIVFCRQKWVGLLLPTCHRS